MFITRQHVLLKNLLELIISYNLVDKAISSIENRFEQFQIYEDIFGFQFNITKLKSLDDYSLQKYCLKLEYFSNMIFIMILMV